MTQPENPTNVQWFPNTAAAQSAFTATRLPDPIHTFTVGTAPVARPTVVCLCGSTRFGDTFREANLRETLAGRIVLSIGCDMRSDAEVFGAMTEAELTQVKTDLDELHKRKIDLADEILVLNVGGYIGDSTRSEIAYAREHGKPVRWLEEPEQLREMASRLPTLANEAEAGR